MITIVSGQPRSGTTLMMNMLHKGGLDVYADTHAGYESHAVVNIQKDNSFLHDCAGKAVKILHPHILHLPHKIPCKIIWMHRDPREQAKSQRKFMNNQGYNIPRQAIHKLKKAIERDNKGTLELFKGQDNIEVLKVRYEELKTNASTTVICVEDFLDIPMDIKAMAKCIQNNETKSQPDLSVEVGLAEEQEEILIGIAHG